MNKYFVILSFLMLSLNVSCISKQDQIIAINVLLTLPDEVYDQSVELNHVILKENPNNFTLDKNHVPHITLLQCYIKKSDLPQIEKALDGLYQTIENEMLYVDELQYSKAKPESFASLGIEKSKTLMSLHKEVIKRLDPYRNTHGSQEAYVQNFDDTPIDQFTIDYVPKFVSHHSFENYNPHISLGVAKILLLDSIAQNILKPMHFKPSSISIYQLGAFGTARKQLWKSKS